MSRPVVIGVELVTVTDEDGNTRRVPDIGEGIREHFVKTGPDTYTASWGEHALTIHRIGRLAGKLWFIGSGSRRILVGLVHLGADIKLVRDLTRAQRDAVLARGFKAIRRVRDSAIVGIHPPVVFAGDDPIAVGLDGQLEEGEEYTIG